VVGTVAALYSPPSASSPATELPRPTRCARPRTLLVPRQGWVAAGLARVLISSAKPPRPLPLPRALPRHDGDRPRRAATRRSLAPRAPRPRLAPRARDQRQLFLHLCHRLGSQPRPARPFPFRAGRPPRLARALRQRHARREARIRPTDRRRPGGFDPHNSEPFGVGAFLLPAAKSPSRPQRPPPPPRSETRERFDSADIRSILRRSKLSRASLRRLSRLSPSPSSPMPFLAAPHPLLSWGASLARAASPFRMPFPRERRHTARHPRAPRPAATAPSEKSVLFADYSDPDAILSVRLLPLRCSFAVSPALPILTPATSSTDHRHHACPADPGRLFAQVRQGQGVRRPPSATTPAS
jgi:hypothetical protein